MSFFELEQRVKALEDCALKQAELLERMAKTCAEFASLLQGLLDKLGAPKT